MKQEKRIYMNTIIVCGEQIHVLFLTIVLLRLWLTGFIQFLKQYYKPERQVPFINLTIMQNKLKKCVVPNGMELVVGKRQNVFKLIRKSNDIFYLS